ncbi:hypothetical protein MMC12_000979 [Toensbergia leucococca]|nr:hypothetical protein [Toensbergia leucococca]
MSLPLVSEPIGYFPFMRLPREIRDIVYEELLVTSCTQPGVPKKSLNSQFYAAPFARVLEASRTIYTEAIGILYAHNIFSTLNIRANDNIVCFLDKSFIGKPSTRGYSAGHTIEPDWSKIWENCHQAVSDDVAKIYDEDARNLPEWLFGELSDADFQREIINANGRAHLRHVWHYGLGGDQIDLPPFLRQIGPLNAARIESIQICFRDLERTRCQFPFFAEVLKQHVRSLKKLKIDFNTRELKFKKKLEFLTYILDALFADLRQLFKDLPRLESLELRDHGREVKNLSEAFMEERRTGNLADIRNVLLSGYSA